MRLSGDHSRAEGRDTSVNQPERVRLMTGQMRKTTFALFTLASYRDKLDSVRLKTFSYKSLTFFTRCINLLSRLKLHRKSFIHSVRELKDFDLKRHFQVRAGPLCGNLWEKRLPGNNFAAAVFQLSQSKEDFFNKIVPFVTVN